MARAGRRNGVQRPVSHHLLHQQPRGPPATCTLILTLNPSPSPNPNPNPKPAQIAMLVAERIAERIAELDLARARR